MQLRIKKDKYQSVFTQVCEVTEVNGQNIG